MPEVSVRGVLMRWAREQLGFTGSEVTDRGGPSKTYLCELEKGTKSNIQPDFLSRWATALGVTVDFAQGKIPRYHKQPQECIGLVADIGRQDSTYSKLENLDPIDRPRALLELISSHRKLPLPVLAFVLSLEVQTVRAYITGEFPVPGELIKPMSDLTMVSETFIKGQDEVPETSAEIASYFPAVRLAIRRKITPAHLEDTIRGMEPR